MNRRTLIITVVLVSVAINMCQGVVLCLGGDGHVVVEVAGHRHCCDGEHEHHGSGHDHGSDTSSHGEHVASGISVTHCVPCEDAPLSVGICKDGFSSGVGKIKACVVNVDTLPVDSLRGSVAESIANGADAYITSFQLSLRSVVLQV